MVSLKALRIVTGITGLTALTFVGGYFFGKENYRKIVNEQSYVIAFQEVNSALEKKNNKDNSRLFIEDKLSDFKETIASYLLVHEDLSSTNTALAMKDLEGCILQELNDAEDFVLSLKARNFSPEVISDATAFYKKINLAARDYVYRSKLERENPLVAEPWYSPRIKREH